MSGVEGAPRTGCGEVDAMSTGPLLGSSGAVLALVPGAER